MPFVAGGQKLYDQMTAAWKQVESVAGSIIGYSTSPTVPAKLPGAVNNDFRTAATIYIGAVNALVEF